MVTTACRIVFWCAALVLASLPIMFTVAPSLAKAPELLQWSAYGPYAKDVSYLAVAILSIGLVEVLECIATTIPPDAETNRLGLAASIILAVVMFVLIVIFTIWSANAINMINNKYPRELYIVEFAVALAFLSRVTLLFGAAK